jgi:hypothetical protein
MQLTTLSGTRPFLTGTFVIFVSGHPRWQHRYLGVVKRAPGNIIDDGIFLHAVSKCRMWEVSMEKFDTAWRKCIRRGLWWVFRAERIKIFHLIVDIISINRRMEQRFMNLYQVDLREYG